MEKNIVTRLTTLVVAISLVVALGAAFWRASYKSGDDQTTHQHNHHSLEFFAKKPACS